MTTHALRKTNGYKTYIEIKTFLTYFLISLGNCFSLMPDTSHGPNRMLMRENKEFLSLAFDSAHVKYSV